MIFLTKSDGTGNRQLARAHPALQSRTAEIVECAHRPLYLQESLFGRTPVPGMAARQVCRRDHAYCTQPESFEEKLSALGVRLEIAVRYADHHRFTERELSDFISRCSRRDLDCIVTTEKDSVRFPYRQPAGDVPIYYLRVEIAKFSPDRRAGKAWWIRICEPQSMISADRFFA